MVEAFASRTRRQAARRSSPGFSLKLRRGADVLLLELERQRPGD
ncbi:MAG: hypothetical protein AB1730_18065 [Myxococcota bacterium]|jgi:hypothetical protein